MTRSRAVSALLVLMLFGSVAALLLYESGALPYKVYVVHTGSMYPSIPPESAVVVREGQYRVGGVVAFTEHGSIVSHRLMAIKADGTIVTKGDANRSVDPWRVSTSNIIGGVVAAPRHLGYLLTYVKTPTGATSILAALLCLWQIWALAGDFGRDGGGPRALNAGVAKPRARSARKASSWSSDPLVLRHLRL